MRLWFGNVLGLSNVWYGSTSRSSYLLPACVVFLKGLFFYTDPPIRMIEDFENVETIVGLDAHSLQRRDFVQARCLKGWWHRTSYIATSAATWHEAVVADAAEVLN